MSANDGCAVAEFHRVLVALDGETGRLQDLFRQLVASFFARYQDIVALKILQFLLLAAALGGSEPARDKQRDHSEKRHHRDTHRSSLPEKKARFRPAIPASSKGF